MRSLAIWIILFSRVGLCLAQTRPLLPDPNFDRRSDQQYMDSLRSLGQQHIRTAERLSRTLRNDTTQLEGLRYLAVVFKQWRNPPGDSSLYYATKLVQQARLLHNDLYQVRGLMLEEFYYRVRKNDYPKALQINQQASLLAAGLPKTSSPLWQVEMNMGDIYVMLRDYPKALQSYQTSLRMLPLNTLVSRQNRKLLMAQVVTQIGEVYERQKKFDAARIQFEESRRLNRETTSLSNIIYADERLGDFYNTRHQPEKAIPYYEEALVGWKQLNSAVGEASVWARLAECFVQIKNVPLAISYGERAMDVARRQENLRIRQMASQALYHAYRADGQTEKALIQFEEFNMVKDSLNKQKRVEETLALQNEYAIRLVREEAEKNQLIQQRELMDVRRQAEIARLRAEAEREQIAGENRMNQLRQRIETERLRADSQRSRLEQRARIESLSHTIEQESLMRLFLVSGLAMLLIFVAVYYRKSQLIARQKQEIEGLNRGLEDKVAERTVELKLANDQLRAKNREIEEALLRGQTLERKRMAADLHDSLGGLLAAIKVSLSALNPTQMPEREQQIYRNLLGMTKEAFAEVRYLSHNLQPDELEKQGLSEALKRLVNKLNSSQQVTFRLDNTQLPRLDKTTEFNLYSICIELCSNILRHSEATEADIIFRRFSTELNMIVKDNGCGMDPADASGMGLRNIQARMDAIRGRYEVHSGANEGTTFIFILPTSSDMAPPLPA
ncbi:tetratricopeptide repeat-containing sensor histidine kinase [Spirosoma endbachense]|uniref:histidine kinase n=1 Tax=Spirosoma endbachense TaxID=2666025 RepID=A0A6P1W220_9BACT|nr:tetratricopeptide repeat protein [Spirosoma endbachense]QHV98638.1 histidine kinase [Spirosoma endbachense]